MEGLEEDCRALFARHRVTAFGGAFHVPDVERYPALFAWDSGYHALSTRHLDPGLAWEELITLYSSNRLPDGLLSHQRFVPGAEDAQHMIEDLFGPMFDGDRTPFIDPPTAAYAAARLTRAAGPAGVRDDRLLDSALEHLAAMATRRVVAGGVLPVTLHPFETGTEGSAYMQALWNMDSGSALERLKALTISAVKAEMDVDKALAGGHGFVTHDPTMCAWYLLALEETAEACRLRGRHTDASWAGTTAEAVAEAHESLLWWEEGELFTAYDLVEHRQVTGTGAMGLLAASSATIAAKGLARRAADRHLRPGSVLWGPAGFASGRVDPAAGVRAFVQWDGNAVWGATVYWAHLVAMRLERVEIATQLRQELEALVRSHGFREFYDACTGEPGGAGAETGFTWPALVLEMAANDRPNAASR